MNVVRHFENSFLKNPERPALNINGESFTYRELRMHATSIASAMDESLSPTLPAYVAIFAHRSLAAYIGILGTLYAGRTYLPLNPRFPESRNKRMIDFTKATCIVADKRCAENLPGLIQDLSGLLIILPEHASLPAWCSNFPKHRFITASDLKQKQITSPRHAELDSGAYILFTSGSTGIPKGVMVRHGNLESYLESIEAIVNIRNTDRCTQHFDLTFDVSVHDLFATWKAGACLFVVPENAGLFGIRFVNENQITVWYSVPSTGAMLRDRGFLKPNTLPTLRYSLFIGEALTTSLAKDWQVAAPQSELYNLYGPTEATISVTEHLYKTTNQYPSGVVPIGKPNINHTIAIVDSSLVEVAPGESGELCVCGPQITGGYWQDPKLTAEKFVQLPNKPSNVAWYRTGDLAEWHDEFGLLFRGRADRQIKLRGFRVELGEIETALRQASQCEMVAIVATRSAQTDNYMSAVAFVANGGQGPNEEDILTECRKLLPDYMVPNRVIFLDMLPTNTNGKIDYRVLETEHLS